MEDKKSNIRLIVIYLVITYFVSGIGYLIWFQPKQNEFAAFIPILGPLFGAITVYCITNRKINLMINKISVSGIITGAFIPVIYVLSLGCIFLITGNQFKSADVTGKEIVILLIQWIFAGVCEEIGWRGVVFPVLNRIVKFSTACIFTGIFWAIWHIPMIYGGIIVTQQPKFMAIFMFCAETIIMSFILGIISRSEM